MTNLSHTLLYTSLTKNCSNWITNARKQLSCATELEWRNTIGTLALHRLLPLVFYSLQDQNLTDTVPPPYLVQMQTAYRHTRKKNTILLLTLDGILQAMAKRGLNPVLWKGVVLADNFYPDLGTRLMEDIDFAIPVEEMEAATEVFQSLGFKVQPEAETSDAIYFANKMGVVCDVHHRVRLFEGQESINLITHLQPKHMKVPTMPVLEPNAMVVHLIVHMDGHRHETGPMLCWILDLAFVLRKWGTLIKPEYIEKLMPAKENLVSLFRIVRFLEQEFDQQLPACLTQGAKNFEPLTLAEIFRQRRLALWGLPRPNGWLRLGASQLGFQLLHRRPKLQIDDLLLLPLDTLRNLRIYNRLIPIKKYHLNQAKAGR
ncbi:MAG: nucleotidyltransferase family protein [Symploca sp. SIO3C6]|uniref:Nucleotidyltransferase family protein n=1 Tax=Symploca sp. SIO1C4 TaxID=2607765 RepID=A0A6B3NC21_9CYAN|nr:nucleotidyltransferase family protein [Symploca sp. SIO3C6]NER27181.1 nucleotidyltransferase family protein [Symploca sp. SIO1C4]NET04901.1 nucleotidyltransferase family protein [Symploca sp. SIO2B6]